MVSQHKESNIKFVAYFALFFLINKIDTGEKNASSQSDEQRFYFLTLGSLARVHVVGSAPCRAKAPFAQGGKMMKNASSLPVN